MVINPCLACSPRLDMRHSLEVLKRAGCEYIHVDICDGKYTPNLALDFETIRQIKQEYDFKVDAHLMVSAIEPYVDAILDSGTDFVCFHPEITPYPHAYLRKFREAGIRAGLALNPIQPASMVSSLLDDVDYITLVSSEPGFPDSTFMPQTLEKIGHLVWSRKQGEHSFWIQVKGSLSLEMALECKKLGANMVVVGRSLYYSPLNLADAFLDFQVHLNTP